MKKILGLTCAFMLFATALFAVDYPFSINETFSNGDCIITMTGSGTITINPPSPGQTAPLSAEAHGTVTFKFSPDCGMFGGMSVTVTFSYHDPNDGHAGTLTGDDEASQEFLQTNPEAAAHLKDAIQANIHYD